MKQDKKADSIKRIFKGCTLKFTESKRISEFKYEFTAIKKECVYIFTDSKLKGIKYVDFASGFTPKLKRCKSLKIIGGFEISEKQFKEDCEKWAELINSKKTPAINKG